MSSWHLIYPNWQSKKERNTYDILYDQKTFEVFCAIRKSLQSSIRPKTFEICCRTRRSSIYPGLQYIRKTLQVLSWVRRTFRSPWRLESPLSLKQGQSSTMWEDLSGILMSLVCLSGFLQGQKAFQVFYGVRRSSTGSEGFSGFLGARRFSTRGQKVI